MKQMTLTYPEDLEKAADLTPEQLERHVRLMAAIKMFEVGELSSGKAAEFAGLPRVTFLETCARYRVPGASSALADLETELRSDARTAAEEAHRAHRQ